MKNARAQWHIQTIFTLHIHLNELQLPPVFSSLVNILCAELRDTFVQPPQPVQHKAVSFSHGTTPGNKGLLSPPPVLPRLPTAAASVGSANKHTDRPQVTGLVSGHWSVVTGQWSLVSRRSEVSHSVITSHQRRLLRRPRRHLQ